jgi:hypothetical protein
MSLVIAHFSIWRWIPDHMVSYDGLIALIFCFWLIFSLLLRIDTIDRCFSHDTVEEIIEALVSIVFVHGLMKNFKAWPMKCNYETINLLDSYCLPDLSFAIFIFQFFLKNINFLKASILCEELHSKLFAS